MNKLHNFDLSTAFSEEDVVRVLKTYKKLSKHIKTFALTGGVLSAYYFDLLNYPLKQRKLSDLDIVIQDPSEVENSIVHDFLVSHYHPLHDKGKFHIMLIDPETKIRIDVFPPLSTVIQRVELITINKISFMGLPLEDLVSRLLLNCLPVLRSKEIDPKYFFTMLSLYGSCNKVIIKNTWNDYGNESSFDEMYWAVLSKIKNSPELLKKTVYSQDLNFVCQKCSPPDHITLVSNQQAHDLLGYV